MEDQEMYNETVESEDFINEDVTTIDDESEDTNNEDVTTTNDKSEDINNDKNNIKTIKKPDTNILILNQYYQRYSLCIKTRKPIKAINYFINIYNHIEKNPQLYTEAINLFKQNRNILHETIALQGIETILPQKRLKIETFYTLLKAAVNNEKLKINFDIVNEIVKNTDLLKEYKKEFNKHK